MGTPVLGYIPGMYMESMVPPPPASGSGEGQRRTQIQDPPLLHQACEVPCCSKAEVWKLLLQEVCHHPECCNRPCLTSWLPHCQQLTSINLPLAQPWPQAKRWGTDFRDIEEVAFPVEQVHGPVHLQGISWCTQDGAGQRPGRGPAPPPPSVTRSCGRVTHWPSQGLEEGTEGMGLSIPKSVGSAQHPGQHHVSGDGIPLKGASLMNH